ncbi:hypothetical protein EV424DRAFT_1325459, partial [Suillus variegatus]
RFATYVTSKMVSHLNDTVQQFQLVLDQCPVGYPDQAAALTNLTWLAQAVGRRFKQCSTIDDLNECVQHHCEFVSLCSEGHPSRETCLNNLALPALINSHNLNEAISLYEEALHLRPVPVGHIYHDFPLNDLGLVLLNRFNKYGDVNDIIIRTSALSLQLEAVTLHPPGNAYRDFMFNNFALVLKTK